MILSNALQYAYNKLYEQLRKYLWDMNVVQQIASLEIEVYRAIPDLSSARQRFGTLHTSIKDTAKEDEDLLSAVELFRKTLESASDICCKLEAVREEVSI